MTADREFAESRRVARGGDNRRRQWAPDYEFLGLRGEQAVSLYLGCHLDKTLTTPGGDGGIDTWLTVGRVSFPVQIKCSRRPKHLPCEAGRVIQSAIYILCRYDDAEDVAYCCGWEWGVRLQGAPVIDCMGKGVLYHAIPRTDLRRMVELRERVVR